MSDFKYLLNSRYFRFPIQKNLKKRLSIQILWNFVSTFLIINRMVAKSLSSLAINCGHKDAMCFGATSSSSAVELIRDNRLSGGVGVS